MCESVDDLDADVRFTEVGDANATRRRTEVDCSDAYQGGEWAKVSETGRDGALAPLSALLCAVAD